MALNSYIVDTHCHLDLIEQKGISLDEVVINAQKNQVKILQTICTRVTEIKSLLKYTKKYDFIYTSIGTHPCNISEQPLISHKEIIKICQNNPKIIGIGETGLDYYHNNSTSDLQKRFFLEHIEASRETNLPLIIHSRNCDSDMMEILKSEQKRGKFPALLHCFSSSRDLARHAIDLGIYISISGIVTFNNASSLQKIVRDLPLEFLLIETDSPYLAPHPFRGKINQPAFVKSILEFIAELKGIDADKIAQQTTKNFLKLFKKAKPSE